MAEPTTPYGFSEVVDVRVLELKGVFARLTDAVPVVAAERSDASWLDARRGGIGASEMPTVLRVQGAYSSPFALWCSKTLGWDSEQSFAMRIGHLLEPIVAQLFAEQRPDLVVLPPKYRLWRSADISWLLASPDSIAINQDSEFEPVECKTDEGSSWGTSVDGVPERHRVQLGQQCWVLGARRGHLVRLWGKRMAIYTLDFDPEDPAVIDERARWRAAGDAFMDLVCSGDMPELDGHEATTEALQRLNPEAMQIEGKPVEAVLDDELIERFWATRNVLKLAKARHEHSKNLVRAAMGNAVYGIDAGRRRVLQRRQYKRDGYTVAPSLVDSLHWVGAEW